jgi:REP element-mobilizing transposase RayT
MQFTPIGAYVHQELTEMGETHIMSNAERNLAISVPQFVVMPNHVHIIYWLESATDMVPLDEKVLRNSISNIVGRFKQAVTRYARQNQIVFAWQRNFYDHIIRDEKDRNNISQYIAHNVQQWDADKLQ